MASNDDDGTGENPWDTYERHHPQATTILTPTIPAALEIASKDPDQAEEEDFDENDSDDDDDVSADEHARARKDAEILLASKVGEEGSPKCASSRKTAVWTVVRSETQPFVLDEPRPPHVSGMVGGLPLLPSGDPDILALWLALYPGDMSRHLEVMNATVLRGNIRHKNITNYEYVRFWGLILRARQFSEKGKNLYMVEF